MSDMPDLRMEAYWYGFAHTGNRQVDEILSAVACAGKAAHDTSCWGDEVPNHYGDHLEGLSPIAWIQSAAQRAADHVEREWVPKSEYDKVSDSCCLCCKNELAELKANSVPRDLVNELIEATEKSPIAHSTDPVYDRNVAAAIKSIRERENG